MIGGWVASFGRSATRMEPLAPIKVLRHGDLVAEFRVEKPVTARAMRRGLMFRDALPSDRGMLFHFRRPRPVWVWMKNTFFPLDILFLDVDLAIVQINAAARPLSREKFHAIAPALAVLELPGGCCRDLDLKIGDVVVLS